VSEFCEMMSKSNLELCRVIDKQERIIKLLEESNAFYEDEKNVTMDWCEHTGSNFFVEGEDLDDYGKLAREIRKQVEELRSKKETITTRH